jgi:diacylglycerol O-acyltransferase / wax synthase
VRVARYAYERLSTQDATFLWAERENAPMHVGAVAILESGPLRNADGGVDFARYRSAIESVLHWIPRYRQKLAWTPLEGWPVWVDDRHFDIGYHLRHLSLARPGTLEQLRELASRILARPLDRSRPLWEIWVIEGLEGGEQFALLNKVHHCMIDGAAGANISQILMSPSANSAVEPPMAYMPRPAPTSSELLLDSLRDRMWRPVAALQALFDAPEGVTGLLGDAVRRARSLGELLGYITPASATPLNGELSPHRRLDWLTMPLGDLLELRAVLECTVNDLVLAIVTGALRRYLFRRRVDVAKLDFRVATPVSTRTEADEQRHGNHVSTWILNLPLAEADPLAQLATVRERTAALKRSNAALGADTVMKLAEWLPTPVVERGVAIANGPTNLIVTNIPGPQFPLYMVGAPLLGMYPVVPLLPGVGLGIALFSYDGKLCWGFNADYELVPDLRTFHDDVCVAFEQLRGAAVARYMQKRTARAETEVEVEIAPAAEAKPKPRRRAPRGGSASGGEALAARGSSH